jgi:hypothetical protein
MNQIALSAADDLLSKLIEERVRLRALLVTPSGIRVRLPGFVDSKTRDGELIISVSGPPCDSSRGVNFLALSV